MQSFNRIEIIGRLGRDPLVRLAAEDEDGETHARLSIATDRPPKPGAPRSAETQTDWHHVTCWGRVAEFAGRYLSRGRLVFVAGRLQYSTFEGRGGETHRTAEIVATEIVPLDRRPDADGNGSDGHDASDASHEGQRGAANDGGETPASGRGRHPANG